MSTKFSAEKPDFQISELVQLFLDCEQLEYLILSRTGSLPEAYSEFGIDCVEGCPLPMLQLLLRALKRELYEHSQLSPDEKLQIKRSLELDKPPAALMRQIVYSAKLKNAETGEEVTTDSLSQRIRRCQVRVGSWADAVEHLVLSPTGDKISTGNRMLMLTLTYADADAWQPNDIRQYMLALRGALGSSLLAYSWVLEMQDRGAPHYHIVIVVKGGTYVPLPDESGMWAHGMSNLKTARTPHYISAYTGKEKQKAGLPRGARMFAVWIAPDVISSDARWEFRLSTFPSWLRDAICQLRDVFGYNPDVRYIVGKGFVDTVSGELFCSPWRLVSIDRL